MLALHDELILLKDLAAVLGKYKDHARKFGKITSCNPEYGGNFLIYRCKCNVIDELAALSLIDRREKPMIWKLVIEKGTAVMYPNGVFRGLKFNIDLLAGCFSDER